MANISPKTLAQIERHVWAAHEFHNDAVTYDGLGDTATVKATFIRASNRHLTAAMLALKPYRN